MLQPFSHEALNKDPGKAKKYDHLEKDDVPIKAIFNKTSELFFNYVLVRNAYPVSENGIPQIKCFLKI